MASHDATPSARQPHVLLAWELGANRGHVTTLGAVTRELLARGARVTFASQRLDALRPLRPLPDAVAVVQAPVWPGLLLTASFRPQRPPATFGDILADLGLRDSGVVEFLLRGWDTLLAALRPDAVVADFAPMVQLAAKGRVPVVAVGTGFSLPPAETATFPPLRMATPLFEEAQVLDAVNLGLARTGRPPIDRLPQVGEADLRRPHVFTLFDPYRTHRREQPLPPILPTWSPARAGDGEEVFVYFADTSERPQRLWDALARIGPRARIYVPNLPEPAAQALAAAGVQVEKRPQSARDIARRSRVVVSHGGLGFVSMTLAAGLPQVVLAPDLEKRLVGAAVSRLGAGRSMAWRDATPEAIGEAIRAVEGDDAIRARALEIGDGLAPLLAQDSAAQLAEDVLGLCPPSP